MNADFVYYYTKSWRYWMKKKIMYSSHNFANYGNRWFAKSLGKTVTVFEI